MEEDNDPHPGKPSIAKHRNAIPWALGSGEVICLGVPLGSGSFVCATGEFGILSTGRVT